MASTPDWSARGKVLRVQDGKVVFAPSNTNYELQLETAQPYKGPIGEVVYAMIRAKARKVYTVPSGGGFIAPIFGPPKTIQGRALYVTDNMVVIKAGLPVCVEFPKDDSGMDLEDGPISVGTMVNAVALPGANFEMRNVNLAKK